MNEKEFVCMGNEINGIAYSYNEVYKIKEILEENQKLKELLLKFKINVI